MDRQGFLSGTPSSIVYCQLCRVHCLNHVMVFLRSDWTVPTTCRMEIETFSIFSRHFQWCLHDPTLSHETNHMRQIATCKLCYLITLMYSVVLADHVQYVLLIELYQSICKVNDSDNMYINKDLSPS